ncbi:hypothetical protein AMC82_PD00922 (plasmid) [Rhizobium phaseoli]|nr:hypothetical protein AMC84_PD00926 [Rhizobium phaseoli]ANL76320.1 hypothetical protein AMC83_PE00912 [Rhizobium phaseoli]ANL82676.1 hypothetical protein AMC82_PD00922 [Rhizobium phaseoli]
MGLTVLAVPAPLTPIFQCRWRNRYLWNLQVGRERLVRCQTRLYDFGVTFLAETFGGANRSGDPEQALRIYRSPPRRQKSPHLQRLFAAVLQRCSLIIARNSPYVRNPMCRASRWTVVGETRHLRATPAALSKAVMSGLSRISLATCSRLPGNTSCRLAIRRFSSCSVEGGESRSCSIALTFKRADFMQLSRSPHRGGVPHEMREVKSGAFRSD